LDAAPPQSIRKISPIISQGSAKETSIGLAEVPGRTIRDGKIVREKFFYGT